MLTVSLCYIQSDPQLNSPFFPSLNHSLSASANTMVSNSELEIRSARHEDLQSLAEILTNSFHPPHGLMWWMNPILKLGIYEDLRGRLNSGTAYYICLVASKIAIDECEKKRDIVGTVEMSVRSNNSWPNLGYRHPYISNLAVKSSCRRQGVARKLLQRCEQIALAWKFQEISLHVLENNEQAKHLYFSSGYQLRQTESNFNGWVFNHPERLLLSKRLYKAADQTTSIGDYISILEGKTRSK